MKEQEIKNADGTIHPRFIFSAIGALKMLKAPQRSYEFINYGAPHGTRHFPASLMVDGSRVNVTDADFIRNVPPPKPGPEDQP